DADACDVFAHAEITKRNLDHVLVPPGTQPARCRFLIRQFSAGNVVSATHPEKRFNRGRSTAFANSHDFLGYIYGPFLSGMDLVKQLEVILFAADAIADRRGDAIRLRIVGIDKD